MRRVVPPKRGFDDRSRLAVLLAALAAGFVQGLSGFAFGLVAMTVWVWTVAPQLAGPLVVFGSLVGQPAAPLVPSQL